MPLIRKRLREIIDKERKKRKKSGAREGAGEPEQKEGTIENQSIMIFLNEEGNVAALILLIRLSISPQRPTPGAI